MSELVTPSAATHDTTSDSQADENDQPAPNDPDFGAVAVHPPSPHDAPDVRASNDGQTGSSGGPFSPKPVISEHDARAVTGDEMADELLGDKDAPGERRCVSPEADTLMLRDTAESKAAYEETPDTTLPTQFPPGDDLRPRVSDLVVLYTTRPNTTSDSRTEQGEESAPTVPDFESSEPSSTVPHDVPDVNTPTDGQGAPRSRSSLEHVVSEPDIIMATIDQIAYSSDAEEGDKGESSERKPVTTEPYTAEEKVSDKMDMDPAPSFPSGDDLLRRVAGFLTASDHLQEQLVALSVQVHKLPAHSKLPIAGLMAVLDVRIAFITILRAFISILKQCVSLTGYIEAFCKAGETFRWELLQELAHCLSKLRHLTGRLNDTVQQLSTHFAVAREAHLHVIAAPQPRPGIWRVITDHIFIRAPPTAPNFDAQKVDGICTSIQSEMSSLIDSYDHFRAFWTLWDVLEARKAQKELIAMDGATITELWDIRKQLNMDMGTAAKIWRKVNTAPIPLEMHDA